MKLNDSKLSALKNRTKAVNISKGLIDCLTPDKDGKAEWVVKNLSFDEIQKTLDEVELSRKILKEELSEISTGTPIGDALVGFIKVCKEAHQGLTDETIKRLSLLKYGTVSHEVSHAQAVKVALNFGLDFKMITDQILVLAQMGSMPVGE